MPAGTLAVAQVSSPTAPRGASIDVFGTGFDATTTAAFNGTVAIPGERVGEPPCGDRPTNGNEWATHCPPGTVSAVAGSFTVNLTGPPRITSVSPTVINTGATFTVTGTGFDPKVGNNTVKIGGTQAIVTSATATALTVQAPPFHPAGPLTVRTQYGTGAAAVNVTTAPFPFIAADVGWTGQLPWAASTTVTTASTKVGVAVLAVPAGTPFRLEVTGSSYPDCPDVRPLAPGNRPVWRSSCAAVGQASPVTTSPTAASFVVLINGATSPGSITLRPTLLAADSTAIATVGGPAVALVLAPQQRGVVTFRGSAGQRVRARVTASGSCVAATLKAPTAAPLATASCGSFDPITLPVRGTYRVHIPEATTARTLAASVTALPADLTTTLTLDGPAVSLTTAAQGQRAVFSFTATAGSRGLVQVVSSLGGSCRGRPARSVGRPLEHLTVGLRQHHLHDRPRHRRPLDRGRVHRRGGHVRCRYAGRDHGLRPLGPGRPVHDDDHRRTQRHRDHGSRSERGHHLPRHGWNTVHRSGLGVLGGNCPFSLTLLDAAGELAELSPCGANSGFLEHEAFSAGTFTLRLDPEGLSQGTTTLSVTAAPPPATAAATVDGPAATVTTAIGQTALVSFTATAGSRVFIRAHEGFPSTGCTQYELQDSTGQVLAGGNCDPPDSYIDTTSLLTAGTYRLRIDPQGADHGAISATVASVPADLVRTATVSGPATTLAIAKAGQGAVVSFWQAPRASGCESPPPPRRLPGSPHWSCWIPATTASISAAPPWGNPSM